MSGYGDIIPIDQQNVSSAETDNDTSINMAQSNVSAGIMGFISVAGLICNVIVILVICILKEYKKTTHWYVLNLAVADGILLVLLPLNLTQSLWGKWMLGLPLCVMYQGTFYVNYYAGVLFLAVMSFDRYVAIVHPVSPSCRRIRSTCGSRLIALAVWTVAIVASAPLMANTTLDGLCDFSFEYVHPECEANDIPSRQCVVWLRARQLNEGSPNITESLEELFYNDDFTYYSLTDEELPSDEDFSEGFVAPTDTDTEKPGKCDHSNSPAYITWIIGNFVLSFVLPLTVMAGCYGGILWRIQHPRSRKSSTATAKTRRRTSSNSGKVSGGLEKKVRITILVVSLVAVFVVCWLPFHAFVLAKIGGINLSLEECQNLQNAVLLIAYSNSLLNPLMYTFLGINFNKRLKSTFSRVLSRTSFKMTISSKGGTKNLSSATTRLPKASTSEPPHVPMMTLGPSQKDKGYFVMQTSAGAPLK